MYIEKQIRNNSADKTLFVNDYNQDIQSNS